MATINDCPYYIEHGDCYDCAYYGDGDEDDAGENCPFEDPPDRQTVLNEFKAIAKTYHLLLFEEVDEEKLHSEQIRVVFYHYDTAQAIYLIEVDLNEIRGKWAELTKNKIHERLVELRIKWWSDETKTKGE